MQTKKSEIVQWINKNTQNCPLTKIEQLGSGVHYCHLMNTFCPSIIPNAKIVIKAKNQVENIINFKQLQQALSKIGVKRILDIDRLSRHSFHENNELASFMMTHLEQNREKLLVMKFVDKVPAPIVNSKKMKENCTQPTQVQQVNEYEQMCLQKNQLREILSDRGMDNTIKIKQIDQLFGFMLSPQKFDTIQPELIYSNEPKMQDYSNALSEKLFRSQTREQEPNQIQGGGLVEEFDLTNFEVNSDVASQQFFDSEAKMDPNQKDAPKQSGHFQLVEEPQEVPQLHSVHGSKCQSTLGFTFCKEVQLQTPQHPSIQSMASSQRKILNLQYESQNKAPQIYSASPQFSHPQFQQENIQNFQIMGNVDQSFATFLTQSKKMDNSSTRESKRAIQSVPVSKSKNWDVVDVNQITSLNYIEGSGGGRMVEE